MSVARTLVAIIFVAFFVAGGFLSYQSFVNPTAEVPPAPTNPEPTDDPVTEPVLSLPEFVLAELGGGERNIREWLGRPLVINFWATWCPPCLREIPMLEAFQDAAQAWDAQVIGIAVDRTPAVEAFAEKDPFNYPILVGQSDGMAAANAFGVDFLALPFTVFASTKGDILAVHTGEIHQGDLDNFAGVIDDLSTGIIDLAAARTRLQGRE